jgi:hypothetical protein
MIRLILNFCALAFMCTASATEKPGNVFVGYDKPIPMLKKTTALRDGSDHNKPIPGPKKKPWNGNN